MATPGTTKLCEENASTTQFKMSLDWSNLHNSNKFRKTDLIRFQSGRNPRVLLEGTSGIVVRLRMAQSVDSSAGWAIGSGVRMTASGRMLEDVFWQKFVVAVRDASGSRIRKVRAVRRRHLTRSGASAASGHSAVLLTRAFAVAAHFPVISK